MYWDARLARSGSRPRQTAMSSRASDGAVVQDLDGDGYEQTGWNILYMHVFEQDRVEPGVYLYAGDRIGHPSCEGGISNASHLHLVRKFNGEWIPADGLQPFTLSGWVSSGNGQEYDGFLRLGIAQAGGGRRRQRAQQNHSIDAPAL